MNAELPLGMEEMNRVFDVVDDLEISRERIQVELLPAGSGEVRRLAGGKLAITLPADSELDLWLPHLRATLTEMRTAEDME